MMRRLQRRGGFSRFTDIRGILLAGLLLGASPGLLRAMSVALVVSPASPQPAGTMVSWTPLVSDAESDSLWFRYRVRGADGELRMIRDFGPLRELDWTSLDEGVWDIELTVQDRYSLRTETTTASYVLTRGAGDAPVVSATRHPLVFVFSSPPCGDGRALVAVKSSDGTITRTPYKTCSADTGLNFYLAGLSPDSSYTAQLVVDQQREAAAPFPPVSFSTGGVPAGVSRPDGLIGPRDAATQNVLLQAPLYLRPFATDLAGRLLWYGPSDLTYMTRTGPDGTFFGIVESTTDPSLAAVRQFDLVGMTVRETNVARVNEQLLAAGRRTISGFHHEARRLSDGSILVLGDVEQILTDVQGPGPIDVIGDMIIVLDSDLQVVWTWDAFDHLEPSRGAVLGENCAVNIGCATHYLSVDANDWTHGNSVAETPDGALLYSARHQDWLLKIDYAGGSGNGDVLWRLGREGDFTFESDDPFPWFSHQHDASFDPGDAAAILLFDNGNTRLGVDSAAHSRGQSIRIDESRRTATLALNLDLGVFSGALGSAQKLENGDYHFNAGLAVEPAIGPAPHALSMELVPDGNVVSKIRLGTPVYRSFRLEDLYGQPADAPSRQGTRLVVRD